MGKVFGTFGETVGEMRRTGFFSWFNLAPTPEAAGAGEVVYRPDGAAFRDLVALTAQAGAGGRLERLTLRAQRSFIDDPRQGAFARDIVKSFLENLAPGDRTAGPIVDEVLYRDPKGPVLMRGASPRLTPAPSAAYSVFDGRLASCVEHAGGLVLTFANQDAWFSVEARPAAARPRSFLARLFGR